MSAVGIAGMTKEVPKPQPTRYTRKFCPDELIAAMVVYLRANGVSVPDGRPFVWGMAERGADDQVVTLVIDAEAKP